METRRWADIVKAELALLQPLINTQQQLVTATVASANVAATLVAAAPAGDAVDAAAAWQTPTQQ